jgi:hypothetical protein
MTKRSVKLKLLASAAPLDMGAVSMMMLQGVVVQSTYAPQMQPGLVGNIVDMTAASVQSWNNETAAGIGFGLAVSQGANDSGCVLGGAKFVGLTVREVTLTLSNVDPQSNTSYTLDALGALHEVAGGGNGAIDGATAALFAAGIAARTRGRVLWCVARQDLFAPAIAQAGLLPDRVIYVEAGDEKSLLACFEEGLRHGALGAVVAEVARLSMTASRRLQLAAELGQLTGHIRSCSRVLTRAYPSSMASWASCGTLTNY